MSNNDLNWIANFIWGIANNVIRDIFVSGKLSRRYYANGKAPIHHDIWIKTCPYTINLVKHTVLLFLTLFIFWFTNKFTEILFPNLPFAVIIIVYISELVVIINFVRACIDDG